MRILLIWPLAPIEAQWNGDLGAISEPLCLEYLAAVAAQDAHEVQILDIRLHPDELDRTLTRYRPDLVGVTAYSMHVPGALACCRRVRELIPAAKTVVGGHHATFLPEDFFADEVDYVVSGEGTGPFRRLLFRLAEGRDPHEIPGLWARVAGQFALGGAQESFDVDSLPTPDRSITGEDRSRYFIDWMRPVALLRTTVGCPFRCSFCSLWQLMDGRYYMRDVDSVVAELSAIKEDFVFLIDDEAFINGPRMRALAAAIATAGIHKRMFAYCRIDSLLRNREVLTAWQDIGLERIFVGIDAIREKDLTEYRKKLKIAQIEEGLRVAHELGLEIFAQFVVNTDYQREDFRQLARFIEHHRIRYPTFTVLTPLPGTDLLATFDKVLTRGTNGRPDWKAFDCQHAVTQTVLPPEEFHSEYRNLYSIFRDRPRQISSPARDPAAPLRKVPMW